MSDNKTLIIHKNNTQIAPFLTLSLSTIAETYKKLNDAEAFYLYLFLCGNTNNYNMPFSPEELSKKCGQSASLIEENFKKLVNAGIIVQKNLNSSTYDFYASDEPINTYKELIPKNMIIWS
ncbi:MAG: hypothetical protein E7353_09270 [Clostridiales bacterium]|nr:hypothetical protein [Clostridiales bacterium]